MTTSSQSSESDTGNENADVPVIPDPLDVPVNTNIESRPEPPHKSKKQKDIKSEVTSDLKPDWTPMTAVHKRGRLKTKTLGSAPIPHVRP